MLKEKEKQPISGPTAAESYNNLFDIDESSVWTKFPRFFAASGPEFCDKICYD